MTTTLARWTLNDYHQMITTGLFVHRRVELLNGLVVEMIPEDPIHEVLAAAVSDCFMAQAQARYQVLMAQPITIAATDSEPEVDIVLVKSPASSTEPPTPEQVYLVLELSDQSLAKDMGEKRRVYAAAGIKDYWVANLRDRELLIYHQPLEGDYQVKQHLRQGTASPLAFPEVVVPVRSLF